MRARLAILEFALGSLQRRRTKSLALLLGLTVVVALFASTLLLSDSLRHEYESHAAAMSDLTVQRLVAGRPALLEVTQANQLRDIPTVRSIRPRVWGYRFMASLRGNLTIVGVEADPALDIAVSEGRLPREDNEIAIGVALAEALALRLGDAFSITVDGTPRFSTIVGVCDSASALRSADLLLTTPNSARRLLGMRENEATDFRVDLTTMDEAEVVTQHIASHIEGARVLDRRLLQRTYELTFNTRSGLQATLLLPALVAFLLLAWERLSGLSADERREIGILKAVGWSTGHVLQVRLWESLLISGFSAILGIGLAYAYVFMAGAPGLSDALLGWSTIYPRFTFVPTLDLSFIVVVMACIIVPFVALSVVPAWRAAMLDPDQALRGLP